MIVLREYEPSPPVALECFDSPALRSLLRKQLRITSLSSAYASICSNGYSGRVTIGKDQFLFLPRYGKEVLDSLLPLAFGVHLDRVDDSLSIDDTGFLLDEAVASLFINSYRASIAKNLRWEYRQELEKNLLSSGSLDVTRSLMAITYGAGQFTWKKSNLTRETALNTVVRRVFQVLSTSLKVTSYTNSSLKRCGDDVCLGILGQPLKIEEVLNTLDRTTIHYRPFLELAEQLSLSSAIVSGMQKSPSFLLKTWQVFENAVRTAIKENIRSYALSVNSSGSLGLYATEAGSNKLEPDIVVYQPERGIFLVADVKYQHMDRLELDRSNLFQMNAYLNGYGLERGSLLYPTSGPFEVKEFRLRWGKTISVFRLPVTSQSAFLSGIQQFLERELKYAPISRTALTEDKR